MSTVEQFDIAPDPTLMEDIGAASFSVADAIIELLANSIDARVGDDRLDIEVLVSPEEIRVVDDGHGMTKDVLAEAVRLGVKMDKVTGNKRTRKGMYGLGLKTAAASLGRWWSVHTRPQSGDREYRVAFDLDEWRRHAGDRDFKWRISIEDHDPDSEGPLGDRPHGTAVVVRKLRERHPMPGPVLDKVGHAYKPHIQHGDAIHVNGEVARPKEFDFFDDSRVEIDEELEDGKRIVGWVALDKQTHNDDLYGLNLYRENQLVEPWNKDWFAAHLMTSRIIGEVSLDFVPVNFHKQGFEKTSDEWKLASAAMKEVLKPVVKASRTMSRGKKDETRFARAIEGLKRATGAAGDLGELSSGHMSDEPEDDLGGEDPAGSYEEGTEVDVEADTLVIDGNKIKLAFIIEEYQSEQTPWDYLFDEPSQELQAVVNSNSLLFKKAKDEQFLGMLALADSVSSWLVRERGFDADQARSIRDRWLFAALQGD